MRLIRGSKSNQIQNLYGGQKRLKLEGKPSNYITYPSISQNIELATYYLLERIHIIFYIYYSNGIQCLVLESLKWFEFSSLPAKSTRAYRKFTFCIHIPHGFHI